MFPCKPADELIAHNHKYIAGQLKDAVEKMGPRTVGAIITDSAPVMAAAGDLVCLKCEGKSVFRSPQPAACSRVPAHTPPLRAMLRVPHQLL